MEKGTETSFLGNFKDNLFFLEKKLPLISIAWAIIYLSILLTISPFPFDNDIWKFLAGGKYILEEGKYPTHILTGDIDWYPPLMSFLMVPAYVLDIPVQKYYVIFHIFRLFITIFIFHNLVKEITLHFQKENSMGSKKLSVICDFTTLIYLLSPQNGLILGPTYSLATSVLMIFCFEIIRLFLVTIRKKDIHSILSKKFILRVILVSILFYLAIFTHIFLLIFIFVSFLGSILLILNLKKDNDIKQPINLLSIGFLIGAELSFFTWIFPELILNGKIILISFFINSFFNLTLKTKIIIFSISFQIIIIGLSSLFQLAKIKKKRSILIAVLFLSYLVLFVSLLNLIFPEYGILLADEWYIQTYWRVFAEKRIFSFLGTTYFVSAPIFNILSWVYVINPLNILLSLYYIFRVFSKYKYNSRYSSLFKKDIFFMIFTWFYVSFCIPAGTRLLFFIFPLYSVAIFMPVFTEFLQKMKKKKKMMVSVFLFALIFSQTALNIRVQPGVKTHKYPTDIQLETKEFIKKNVTERVMIDNYNDFYYFYVHDLDVIFRSPYVYQNNISLYSEMDQFSFVLVSRDAPWNLKSRLDNQFYPIIFENEGYFLYNISVA
ncbi:hypothetical protein [Candidatus Lokiarchaeum ossiferum]|uniref:hypothetical protein n=1 Tax=Candidatus Lokiarchaeum ossiferum TaxID=2951803 RepID=UPI00352CF091